MHLRGPLFVLSAPWRGWIAESEAGVFRICVRKMALTSRTSTRIGASGAEFRSSPDPSSPRPIWRMG